MSGTVSIFRIPVAKVTEAEAVERIVALAKQQAYDNKGEAFAKGAAVRFGSSRAYTTRSVYEVDDEEHAHIGRLLTPLVMAMPPLMAADGESHHNEANLQVDNRLMVSGYTAAPLTDEESRLSRTILQCIRQNKKLMIRLGDDKRQLLTILHAIDAQDEARQIDVGHVFGDEVIQAVIGYAQHDCSLITNYSIPSNMLR